MTILSFGIQTYLLGTNHGTQIGQASSREIVALESQLPWTQHIKPLKDALDNMAPLTTGIHCLQSICRPIKLYSILMSLEHHLYCHLVPIGYQHQVQPRRSHTYTLVFSTRKCLSNDNTHHSAPWLSSKWFFHSHKGQNCGFIHLISLSLTSKNQQANLDFCGKAEKAESH